MASILDAVFQDISDPTGDALEDGLDRLRAQTPLNLSDEMNPQTDAAMQSIALAALTYGLGLLVRGMPEENIVIKGDNAPLAKWISELLSRPDAREKIEQAALEALEIHR